jgi:hypothetical protein
MLNQSVAECERARQLDPLIKANGPVLNTYLYLGQYGKFLERRIIDRQALNVPSRKRFDRAYELDPTLYTGSPVSEQTGTSLADSPSIAAILGLKPLPIRLGPPEPGATYLVLLCVLI